MEPIHCTELYTGIKYRYHCFEEVTPIMVEREMIMVSAIKGEDMVVASFTDFAKVESTEINPTITIVVDKITTSSRR